MPDLCYRSKGGDGWQLWVGEFVNEDPADGLSSFILGVGATKQEALAESVAAIESLEAMLQGAEPIEEYIEPA